MTEYIVDLFILYGQNARAPPGYVKIDVDLNKGAGGEYVYLCYRKNAIDAPITGMNVFAHSSESFPIQSGYVKIPTKVLAANIYIYAAPEMVVCLQYIISK